MTKSPRDGFPVFQEGDVEICLSRKPEDRFVLHSFVLGLHSPFFKVSISERWSGQNDNTISGDPIKWRYQLLFEEVMKDEEPPLLARARLEVSSASGSWRLSPDTASIFLMHAPYVPADNRKTKSRLALIRAHRHYLETLYHKPLDFDTNTYHEMVNTMTHVLRLADIYGSLAIFQIPVETAFRRFKSDLDRLCGMNYFGITYIATLARSAWLFQYVICRMVGDPSWTDDMISKRFETLGVVPLVLKKRSQLRVTMLRLDQTIMFVGLTLGDHWTQLYGHTATLATAAYNFHLLEHLKEHCYGGWKLSSEKYRILKDQGESWPTSRYDKLVNMLGPIKIRKSDFNAVIDLLRTKVADLVSPLLVDHVGTIWMMPDPENWARKLHGLTCVKITTDDLPWKDIPW